MMGGYCFCGYSPQGHAGWIWHIKKYIFLEPLDEGAARMAETQDFVTDGDRDRVVKVSLDYFTDLLPSISSVRRIAVYQIPWICRMHYAMRSNNGVIRITGPHY